MKKSVYIILVLVVALNAFNFDFKAPPAKEEIMEPSVLGDEVEPKKDRFKTPQKHKIEIESKPIVNEVEQDSDIYHESKNLYVMGDISYPKIALLVPSKVIKKYANSVADSILSYLLFKKGKFEFKVFDCVDENPKHIINQLNEISDEGFSLVIAPMTQRGARWIAKLQTNLLIYIPTVNKKEVPVQSDNILFGGIDYEEQIDKLLTFAGDKIAIFNDKSPLSQKIASFVKNAAFSDISYEVMIRSAKVNLKPYLKNNHKLENSSIFLNMPIVKTSLIASQLSVYDVNYANLLLTQIAYNPLIFTLTQSKDRKKMYIANSIGRNNFKLKDINLLFGTNIDFAWVNYSTLLGVDHFFSQYIYKAAPLLNYRMTNNQIAYHVDILKPTTSSFKKVNLSFR
ncbi:MAG: hypothetical protein DSZ06_02350 [Sulfurospirillum sp.]|nr:MAG: hypothetical protein DSZ06_02350 [Sulfurospirillum sp.]